MYILYIGVMQRRTYQRRAPARPRQQAVRKVARKEAKKVLQSQIESKSYDGQLTAIQVDYSTGYVASITENPSAGTSIVAGTGETNYIGKVITPTHLTIRGTMAIGDTTNFMRLIVVQDRAAGIPTLANLLTASSQYSVISTYDRQFNDTYRVLYDKLYTLDVDTPVKAFKIKLSGKKLNRIFFGSTTGTVERGGIYFCLVSDSAAVTHPTITACMWRLFFKDA